MTQKKILVERLKDIGDWIPAYKLRGVNTPYGFCGHQADRRLRELAAEGKILHRINGKYAEYKYTSQCKQLNLLQIIS